MGIDDKLNEAQGRIKQAAGDLTDDQQLKDEGRADEAKGKLGGLIDDAKEKLSDGIDKVTHKDDDPNA